MPSLTTLRTVALVGYLAGVSLMAGCAAPGAIGGRLVLPAASRDRMAVESGADGGSRPFGAQEAVISVVARGEPPTQPPPKCHSIVHTAHGFEPHVLPVAVGTAVVFKNRDQVYHKVFSISPAKSFDLGSQAPGEQDSVVFDSVGVVTVHCELHPEATGFVVVLPTEQFTQPNAQGKFVLPELAPGTYTIAAWHPTYGEVKRRVKVPKGGRLNIKLAF